MCSTSDVFMGDMGHHQPIRCRVSEFLDKEFQQRWQEHGMYTYLAQAPLDDDGLDTLRADIKVPSLLGQVEIVSTNIWMSASCTRASPHYDPYHNLLCVVCGTKVVKLCSPMLTQAFYPRAVWGESANHSSVDFAAPSLKDHPEYRHVLDNELKAELKAGDALFIPEGWWHQVDSTEMTVAINFWWHSAFGKSIGTHMDAYYVRQAFQSLVRSQTDKVVASIKPVDLEAAQEAEDPHPAAKSGLAHTRRMAESDQGTCSVASKSKLDDDGADDRNRCASPRGGAREEEARCTAGETLSIEVPECAEHEKSGPGLSAGTSDNGNGPAGPPTETRARKKARKRGREEISQDSSVSRGLSASPTAACLPGRERRALSLFVDHIGAMVLPEHGDVCGGSDAVCSEECTAGDHQEPSTSVHGGTQSEQGTSMSGSPSGPASASQTDSEMHARADAMGLDGLPARLLASLGSTGMLRVLYAMATDYPKLLDLFLVELMSPAFAYLLTKQLESVHGSGGVTGDEHCSEQQGGEQGVGVPSLEEFYARFYGAVADREQVLKRLVYGRESLARSVVDELASGTLGVNVVAGSGE
ncbi:unnamed protein product [Ostreobium quekettii]|uniref:JmjC domain-containing protein n=1 Tax=Ostreobium quekettii TaxID=121088 RepID=A0A8S1JBL7_9CHLO|nr:unnamed protein product [Ostreobium quekettii]|eukprot:evm.model.scf_1053EXC.3 EVM.evm.TU.scf_1053EXC.3   scf_1053EXC:5569-10958(-)